jgi:hypothetical protein
MFVFDICVLFVAALSTLGVVLGFVAFYLNRESRRADLGTSWQPWALRRGFSFAPSEGEWPNTTSPRVEGSIACGDFLLETVLRSDRVHTRLLARPPDALCARLVCTTASGPRTERVGDASFDAQFATVCAPKGTAARLIAPALSRALQAFSLGRELLFEYERGHIALLWPGEERSDARLDEALRLLEVAADSVERAFHAAA